MADDTDDFLAKVREKFERSAERSEDNRQRCLDDIKFARLLEQWPEKVKQLREDDGQAVLTLSHMGTFIRQVVNQARSNRPSINVIPADSNADPETAEIISGLIRNIEVSSDADVAYDTAIDNAVSGGFGYFRINTAYASDDTFDLDIVFERIADSLSVYEDPDSEATDGSDWNCAFVVRTMTRDDFRAQYKDAEEVDWDTLGYTGLEAPWFTEDSVLVAEYWEREEVESQIVALSNDTVVKLDDWLKQQKTAEAIGITQIGEPRTVKSKKVTQYILTGAEVLEEIEWPGKYIPIVPVYGDEVWVEGKRHFKSLIHDAKDSQREHNYWRSQAADTVALAPRVPFIGPEGCFDGDPEKWSDINRGNIAFVTYRGQVPPQRQAPPTPASGEFQQAIAAIDDMKSIIGLHNPSLGETSNETSGVAIRQRQRQGDVATFHFIDNLTRSIRQGGRILIDLIPKVYSTARVVRILGEDLEPEAAQIAPQDQQQMLLQKAQERGQEIARIYDITAGKYDLVVKAGPSYATQREFAQAEIVEVIRAYPDSAPLLGPMYLRNSDWPGADEAAEKLEAMAGQGEGQQPQIPPELIEQMTQMQQRLQELEAENQQLKSDQSLEREKLYLVDVPTAQAKQTSANASMVKAATPQQPAGLG